MLKTKADIAAYFKARSTRLLGKGMCPKHPANPTMEGTHQCQKCSDDHKAQRIECLKKERCPSHPNHPVMAGRTMCEKCLKRVNNPRRTFKRAYGRLTYRAKTRNINVTLTFKDYVILVKDACCLYCHSELLSKGHGVDRINRKLGYIPGNVAPCCYFCNHMKGRLEGLGFSPERCIELLIEIILSKQQKHR